jgi:hypothetical protein
MCGFFRQPECSKTRVFDALPIKVLPLPILSPPFDIRMCRLERAKKEKNRGIYGNRVLCALPFGVPAESLEICRGGRRADAQDQRLYHPLPRPVFFGSGPTPPLREAAHI